MNAEPETRGINTMQEKSLHAALKAWYARPGDRFEVEIGGYVIDLVQDGLLIEIQTGNFSSIRNKLNALLPDHPVRLGLCVARGASYSGGSCGEEFPLVRIRIVPWEEERFSHGAPSGR